MAERAVVTESQKILLEAVWIVSMLALQLQLWQRFSTHYPHLRQKYVPDGSAFLVPWRQMVRAWEAPEMRAAFRSDPRLGVRLLFIIVLGVLLAVTAML